MTVEGKSDGIDCPICGQTEMRIKELELELARAQAAASLADYWEKQYRIVSAKLEKVRAAL